MLHFKIVYLAEFYRISTILASESKLGCAQIIWSLFCLGFYNTVDLHGSSCLFSEGLECYAMSWESNEGKFKLIRDGPLFFYCWVPFGKVNCLHTKSQRKNLSAEKILLKKLFAQHW